MGTLQAHGSLDSKRFWPDGASDGESSRPRRHSGPANRGRFGQSIAVVAKDCGYGARFELATASADRPNVASVYGAVAEAQRRTTHLIYLQASFSSARASPFKQPDKVLALLMAIDDVTRRWATQLAGGPALGSRKEAFRQRGFEYKVDISQTSGGRWPDEYHYLYEGKRLLFAPHITIGGKQPDRCLSVHLHWDEAKGRAVIAHVGRHKTA